MIVLREQDTERVEGARVLTTTEGAVTYNFLVPREERETSPPPVHIVINEGSRRSRRRTRRRRDSYDDDDSSSSPSPSPPRRKKRGGTRIIVRERDGTNGPYEWLLQLIVVVMAVMMVWVYFNFGYVSAEYHRRVQSLQHVKKRYTILKGHEHVTKSMTWTHALTGNKTIVVREVLEDMLRSSMSDFRVLCMHHVQEFPRSALYKACSVYNRLSNQVYFMLNPIIKGGSKEKKSYKENSIACKGSTRNLRHDSVMVEWERVMGSKMYALFEGTDAVALQIAMDELNGNLHCSTPTTSGISTETELPKEKDMKRTKTERGTAHPEISR